MTLQNKCPHCGEMNNEVAHKLSYDAGWLGTVQARNLYICRKCEQRYEFAWGWSDGELYSLEIVKISQTPNPYPPPRYPLREWNDFFETRETVELGKGGQLGEEYKGWFEGLDIP